MSYNNQGYNNYRHERRINEDDVPESKHTIFIRGLPGSMSTDEIKDYFEDKIGPVSFDFVKTSPDQARLFVAVRFESREDAKTAMNKYADRDFLGYQCQISWFKDIRRFAQYQQTHGGGNSGGGGGNYQVRGSFRGRGGFRGRGNFRNGGGYDRDYDRDRRRRDSDRDRSSRSRSRSRSSRRSSRSRSRSRSSVERSRSPRSRSRSPRGRSESRDRRSRSRDSDASAASRDSSRRSRRDKKKNRRRSRRSPSHSAVSSDEGELHSDADRRRDDSRTSKTSRSASPKQPIAAKIQTPPPLPQIKVNLKTTKEDLEIPVPPVAPVAPVVTPVVVTTPTVDVSKMSFSIGMDSDEILQKTPSQTSVIVPSEEPPRPPQPPVMVEYPCPPKRAEPVVVETAPPVPEKKPIVVNLPPPPCPPSMMASTPSPMAARGTFRPLEDPVEAPPVKRERLDEHQQQPPMRHTPYNSWTPVESKEDLRENGHHAQRAPSTSSQFPTSTRMFAELREFQQQLVRSVKAEPKEESFGLTLSSFSTEDEDDSRKKMAREQRLASMDEFDLERFSITKKKLENAFKNDCNTYAIVIKKLLSKDESLEKPLRMALMETMEDLEKQFMEKIDNHLMI